MINLEIKELLNEFKSLDTMTLKEIADNPNASYEELMVASMIVTDRQFEDGDYYTMEEVFGEKVSDTVI